MSVWFIVGGNPDKSGGGVIAVVTHDRFQADRMAAYYVSLGYRDVRVMLEQDFVNS